MRSCAGSKVHRSMTPSPVPLRAVIERPSQRHSRVGRRQCGSKDSVCAEWLRDEVSVPHMHQPFINILSLISKVNTHGFCLCKHLVNNPVGNGLVSQMQGAKMPIS